MSKSALYPRLFSTDQYQITLPDGHKFPAKKYGMLRKLVEQEGLFQLEAAPLADMKTVALAHDPEYVAQFAAGTLEPAAMRRIGLPWSDVLVKRAFASVGGTISAALQAMEIGWGCTLGGGTHHALRNQGAGFCIFNDIAVAIQFLRNQGLIRRAAVIDLDVHQGDGTAEIFENDSDVFTLSIHCESNFPFRKNRAVWISPCLTTLKTWSICAGWMRSCLPYSCFILTSFFISRASIRLPRMFWAGFRLLLRDL